MHRKFPAIQQNQRNSILFHETIPLKGLPNKKFLGMRCHWHCMHDFCIRKSIILYLGEFEAEFIKALAHESGPQGVLFDEKNRESKISWHCPFK
jgi:hypothetical protein